MSNLIESPDSITQYTIISSSDESTTLHTIGELGPPGKSAYRLALDNGYEGSLDEWLLSLAVSNLPDYSESDYLSVLRISEDGIPYWSKFDKSSIGLNKVDNTSDEEKPLSKAMRDALDKKLNIEDLGDKLNDPNLKLVVDQGEL